jgi:diphosphomevalonate decarboxylase
MPEHTATALAHPNIALIKYWGNQNNALRLPTNASLSMNLAGLQTVTTVAFSADLEEDEVSIDGERQTGTPAQRVSAHLDLIRGKASLTERARVESANNFPMGAGIASSASAFAALTLAGAAAAGLALEERELSALARLGSGSACRSVPAGFVEWQTGVVYQDAPLADPCDDSFAFTIAPPDHWALADVIAVVSRAPKAVSSSAGHALAHTSLFHAVHVATAPDRLQRCRTALFARDFPALAEVVEADSNSMHAVMMTSTPPLFYWDAATLSIMKAVPAWRAGGLLVCYTVDAGPNVHCLCLAEAAPEVARRLRQELSISEILTATPGGGARLLAP